MSEKKMLDDTELITATVLCMTNDDETFLCYACLLSEMDDGCKYALKDMIIKRILETTNNVYIKM